MVASALAGIAASVDVASIDATMAFPVTPQPIPLVLEAISQVGLPTMTTLGNVKIVADGTNTFTTKITSPPPPTGTTPPVITQVSEDINKTDGAQPYPEVVVTGTDFTKADPGDDPPQISDLRVIFQMPGTSGVQEVVVPSASSTATELHAKIPDDVVIGVCQITVQRPDTINVREPNDDIDKEPSPTFSNIAQLAPTGQYVFVTEPYDAGVVVLNGNPKATNPDGSSAFNQVVATIPVGLPGTVSNPMEVALTPDNTRAYVTEYGNGSIAVIDAESLQEVDVNSSKKPSTRAIQPRRLEGNRRAPRPQSRRRPDHHFHPNHLAP